MIATRATSPSRSVVQELGSARVVQRRRTAGEGTLLWAAKHTLATLGSRCARPSHSAPIIASLLQVPEIVLKESGVLVSEPSPTAGEKQTVPLSSCAMPESDSHDVPEELLPREARALVSALALGQAHATPTTTLLPPSCPETPQILDLDGTLIDAMR